MARREIVAKRGCTCCGTGCVIAGFVVPLSLVAVWDVFGVVAAAALWPSVLVLGHAARRLRP